MIPYLNGGRDPAIGLDCWGLCRIARVWLYGMPMLPEIAGRYELQLEQITEKCNEQVATMRKVELFTPRSLITVKRGSLCYHVALCLDDGMILETQRQTGVRLLSQRDFQRAHYKAELESYI